MTNPVALPCYQDVLEGADAYNDGQVVIGSDTSDDRTLVTTSDISGSSVFLDIFETGSATPIYSATIPKADVISNTPIPWALDRVGRNFRHKVRMVDLAASSVTLKGGRDYDMLYRFPTAADGELRKEYIWSIQALQI